MIMYSPTTYTSTTSSSSKKKSTKLSSGGIIAIVVVCLFVFCGGPIGFVVHQSYAGSIRTAPTQSTPAVVMVQPTPEPYYGNASATVVPYGEPHMQQPMVGQPQPVPYGAMPNSPGQPVYAMQYGQPPGQQTGPYGQQGPPGPYGQQGPPGPHGQQGPPGPYGQQGPPGQGSPPGQQMDPYGQQGSLGGPYGQKSPYVN